MYNISLSGEHEMNKPNFDTNVDMPGSAFNAQNNDVKTTIEVLEAMQEDLSQDAPGWAEKNIEATIELVKQYKGVE